MKLDPFHSLRSLKAIKIIAEFYGLQSGLTLAEAFRLERMIIDNENKKYLKIRLYLILEKNGKNMITINYQ